MHSNQSNEKIRDRREEDLPTKVPFWWITVEQQRPKQNCIFHLIHSSISHRSFFAAAFSFLGFTYSMRRSRSAFPLLAASYFLGGFLSLDFFFLAYSLTYSVNHLSWSFMFFLPLLKLGGGQSVWAALQEAGHDRLLLLAVSCKEVLMPNVFALEQAFTEVKSPSKRLHCLLNF